MKLFFSPPPPESSLAILGSPETGWGLPVPEKGPGPRLYQLDNKPRLRGLWSGGAFGFSSLPARLPYPPPPGPQLFPGFSSDQRQAIFMKANRKCLSEGLGTWTPTRTQSPAGAQPARRPLRNKLSHEMFCTFPKLRKLKKIKRDEKRP